MNKKLKSISMLSFIIHGMIGIELITIPINAVKYAKNDAWLCPVINCIIIFCGLQIMFWICSSYPGLNFAEINEKLYGKVLGKLLILVIIIYNTYASGISLRLFGESINVFLLERTPILVIMVVFFALILYCMMMDLETISIVFDVLLPFVLFFIFLLVVLSLSAITPQNLYPPISRGFLPILKGSLATLNPASAFFVFAFILPQFSQPKTTKKYITLGLIIGTIVYSTIIGLCIMVFGATEINYLVFPTLTLSKAIQLENQVFERAESLFMAAWIPNTFTTMIVYYLISTICIKALFHKKKDKIIKLGQIPIIFMIALLPRNIAEVFKMLNLANLGLNILVLVYLPLVGLTVLIKKRGVKNET